MITKKKAAAWCCVLLVSAQVSMSGASEASAVPEISTEMVTEVQMETEKKQETEKQTETEKKPEAETEEQPETEEQTGTEAPPETEEQPETDEQPETETQPETEEQPETETQIGTEGQPETETQIGTEGQPETGTQTGTEEQPETEAQTGMEEQPETEPVTENGSGTETETEDSTETGTETDTEAEEEKSDREPETGGSYGSWYGGYPVYPAGYFHTFRKDYRFTRVEKVYGLVRGGTGAEVYEEMDEQAEVVGKVPYFGLVYILQEEEGGWLYIESGDVRGFLRSSRISTGSYADSVVLEIGEEQFSLGRMQCEKADNSAYTYTHTTVYEVVAQKEYALARYTGDIYEYQNLTSRAVGHAASGCLLYVLESDAWDTGWVYVESGDVRGFVPESGLISGTVAADVISADGEDALQTAEAYIDPEENRSCYYSLKSVQAAVSSEPGEQIAAYALEFVGRLPYIWGGTSLTDGADCSGFTQSVYAAFGIAIPRLAEEQGAYGYEVGSLEEARPGDIIYRASGPHVGIYLGNGMVVECNGDSSNTAGNPGPGPTVSPVTYQPVTSIRRYLRETALYTTGNGSSRTDGTAYTQAQMELIWAVVAQEDNGSYVGALAVISSAMNRTESPVWASRGSNALAQLTSPGQYCYSVDSYWKPRLGGNVPDYVKQAVADCLQGGIRNHPYTCFRSTRGSQTGQDAVQIGGNWFFGN